MKKVVVPGFLIILLLTSTAWAAIGGGDVTFRVKDARNVVFSHDIHVGKNSLKCAECHRLYNIAKMSNGTTMEDMQKGKYCGACHNEQRAFGVKAHCERCHRT